MKQLLDSELTEQKSNLNTSTHPPTLANHKTTSKKNKKKTKMFRKSSQEHRRPSSSSPHSSRDMEDKSSGDSTSSSVPTTPVLSPVQSMISSVSTEDLTAFDNPLVPVDLQDVRLHAALHEDILEMSDLLQEIASRRRPMQEIVISRLQGIIYHLWPSAKLCTYGSFATGLASPKSDIDLVVTGVPLHQLRREPALYTLLHALEGQSWINSIVAIERTAIPVLKLVTGVVPTSVTDCGLIHVDISFDSPIHRGMETFSLVQQMVTNIPGLVPLVMVLKQFLMERGLNDGMII